MVLPSCTDGAEAVPDLTAPDGCLFLDGEGHHHRGVGPSLKLLLDLRDRLEDAGCTIVVMDESIDTSTPVGRLIRNVLGSIAEFEREVIVKRTMDGRLSKARSGRLSRTERTYGHHTTSKPQ